MQLKQIKSYMMPISMGIGILFYHYLNILGVLMPFLIFAMLFVSYSNLALRNLRVSRLHFILLSIQLLGSLLVYQLIYYFDPVVAQSAMICILAPTATSAIVITGMLGGNMASLATYTLISNLSVVLFAPLFFVLTGYENGESVFQSFWIIFQKVFFILLVPLILNVLLKRGFPKGHNYIKSKQSISFYLWNMALIIVTARTVKFIVDQETVNYRTEISIALVCLIICVFQFFMGRRLGRKYNDTVAGGQGLGQKNTVLAIWLSQTYLNPISSLGPGSYILWQNMVNSYQVWKHGRKKNI